MAYCSTSDVGSRLGLDSSQRTRASSRLTAAIRRASVEVDITFRDYGRTVPSQETAESTLDGAFAAGSTTVDLADASSFDESGSGNIEGDTFSWTGKTGNTLTGVTNLSLDHASCDTVQQGAFAHILREIVADIAAGLYLEDEATHQTGGDVRGTNLRERGRMELQRLAHLGTV